MKLGDVWFSAIAEAENSDHMIVVSGRTEIEPFIQSGKFKERTWVFYTRNIPAFGRMLNETLAPFETLPLTIYTEKDPEWNEYREMCELQDQDNDDEDLDE